MKLSALIGKNLGLHLVYTPDKVLGENLLGPAAAHDFPAFDRIETVAVQYLKGVALFEDNQRINEKDAYLLVGTNE